MSIRKRGNSYQVIYRCAGENSPRTETFRSEDEALIRDMQIKLAKKNGTFEPPVRISKGVIARPKDVTMKEFLEEYVTVYGLKKWGNSFSLGRLCRTKKPNHSASIQGRGVSHGSQCAQCRCGSRANRVVRLASAIYSPALTKYLLRTN